ncbi:MAG TPA: plasmid pRiA4b ORF-3 family protein [Xanthobacteraceae bacterium]|jgi:hypothetical protein
MTGPTTQSPAADSFNEIATVRIELRHTDPAIWRQVEVPTAITLKVMHDIIQAVMGWLDCHLWELAIGKRRYGPAMDDGWGAEPRLAADKVRLRDVLKPQKTIIEYTYDFGDGWEHRLTVTDVRAGQPDVSYPRYIAGERRGPPEDCGGIPGFYELLDAIADPSHPSRADLMEWAGDYDPDAFDELRIKNALGRIAKRRSAARTRMAKKNSPAR